MDILKYCFHHDLPINDLDGKASENAGGDDPLAQFMRPDPTYSLLWFSGTRIEGNQAQLGLQVLGHFPPLRDKISEGLSDLHLIQQKGGKQFDSVKDFIDRAEIGETMLLANQAFDYPPLPPTGLNFGLSNYKALLADCLRVGFVVLAKAPHKNGFDLMLHSNQNLYARFFDPFKSLSGKEDLRIFSINLKRMDKERKLYFELHNVNQAPHGAEEILPESVM